MKIIALEEHFVLPQIRAGWIAVNPETNTASRELTQRLEDLAEGRLEQMDRMGIDVQVLSLTTPGTQLFGLAEAVLLARESNDAAAKAVALQPDRFQAFATVATNSPKDAVSELKRCVEELGLPALMLNGRTGSRNIDHPDFFPIFEAAAKLGIPVYIHPQVPSDAVREAYYSGFDPVVNDTLACGAFGWHAETGIQAIRLILAGTFDKLPTLQLILGHWGEAVVSYIERVNMLSLVTQGKLERPVADYFKENFSLTPSGMFFPRMMREAIEIMGIDRIMYAVDYPFINPADGAARSFLINSGLSEADQAKVAHGNWEKLTARTG